MYNTLIIAPDQSGKYGDLPNQKQAVRQIQAFLRGVVLDNGVTTSQIIDAINSQRWDIIWFECHGGPTGIPLNNNEWLSFSDITAHVRQAGAVMCFINTCESELVALQVHYELGIDVIATIARVEDATAYRTAAYLAKNLSLGMSVHDAFEKSRPGQDSIYKLFTDNTLNRMMPDTQRVMQAINDLANRLTLQIDDVRSDVKELRKEIKEVKADVAGVKQDVSELKVKTLPSTIRRVAYSLGFLCLFVALLLTIDDVSNYIGFHAPAAILAVTMSVLASFVLFSYGSGMIQEGVRRIM